MKRTKIKAALAATGPMDEIVIKGWVRTKRDSKGFSFLELNDGSGLLNIQAVVDHTPEIEAALARIGTGASVCVTGALVESPGKGQKWEIRGRGLEVLGEADQETFPLQKKRHSDEFLRTIAHLRPRTNKYGAMFRIRSELAQAIHKFFADKGFFYIHTPIITGSDCEGAGEMFRVTSLEPGSTESADKDFFGKPAQLTVSGQLSAEMFALSLGDVYTFGPTFRAENSNTPRHVAEFWMIEPEMAFADLADNMDLGEEMIKYLVTHILDNCPDDVDLFAKWVDKDLMPTLENILKEPFKRLPYTEAIDILKNAKKEFEYPVEWGMDLQTEHERFLCEEQFKKPVYVHDYPKVIKPFYMRLNDDGRTVAAMDCLVPRIGELIGGSQREERLDMLLARMQEMRLHEEDYWWYLDSRRFGTAPHAGFGMGFERMLMLVTGVANIRDVMPFPRTPNSLEF
ncbi:MAG: asparagine--tRNA ligase [Pseudodesulfovibrio sp.]|uniref:Asparagine--tRNA ligase n=1 Tax=Pseudodesulfovibrio aespoeensis (strain ATCC 700646 / DSM 10631 / Aspo-2) TaxID=643562 RepID=E6VZN4_PSEA9|nr:MULTISPECIES: asparagine--tRNA ligase [Pseudodesulfovibrio]MBU4378088.1 asparagine--tRNA ligase [Pseudomonadota bacterium]ADU62862.1 asparaginyl-tRNA synthetase [Pseudodesulfovibrio aespoeensis Aspo-2]MBU4473664.1 asparagine--tRNA ligase [Pseudomonadota bacterium]MBU4515543.1 asparagine--tRNA ligase [Pseudomonadota bacterium]MBU4523213.1 asparagine--tRNA ligase [Pseudomonadota bacterium]